MSRNNNIIQNHKTIRKRTPAELKEYRRSHAKSIQPLGAAARKKSKKFSEHFDASTGTIDRSKYMTYQDIKNSKFNEVIEQLYYHKEQISKILEEAQKKNFLTKYQLEKVLRNLGLQEVDFTFDNQFNRMVKLLALDAIDFMGKLATGKFHCSSRYSAKALEIRKEAALKILEYDIGKPATKEGKESSGSLYLIDDIAMAHQMGFLDDDLKRSILEMSEKIPSKKPNQGEEHNEG